MNILNINKENILIKQFVTLSPHKVKLSDLTKVCQTAVLTECDRYTLTQGHIRDHSRVERRCECKYCML